MEILVTYLGIISSFLAFSRKESLWPGGLPEQQIFQFAEPFFE